MDEVVSARNFVVCVSTVLVNSRYRERHEKNRSWKDILVLDGSSTFHEYLREYIRRRLNDGVTIKMQIPTAW